MNKNTPQDPQEIATDQERRKLFLRYLNRGWLILGIVTLVTLPIFPEQRSEFTWVIVMAFPTYLIVRFFNMSGRTRLAGVIFTLVVNFGFYGLFLRLVNELGPFKAFETQATVWMLMGLAVLFAGALVDKWAAPVVALFNTILLVATRLSLAPGSPPRPSVIVFWWMLALTIWLYERTLSRALERAWTELAERRKAEMELQESMNFFQQVVDTSPSMIFVVDSMGKAVFVNRYTAQYYGTTPEQLIAKSTQDVHQREKEAAEFVGDDQEVIRTRKSIVKEELNTAPNGEQHWFHTVKVPLLRSDGTVEALGISTDITERKQAEEALQESEQNLRRAQQIAHLGHWSWDMHTNRVNLSDEMHTIYGLDRGSFNRDIREIIQRTTHPDDMARVLSTQAETGQGQYSGGIEYRIVRPDGAIRHIWAEPGDRVTDESGKILKLSGIVQDITERKQAEDELRESEERYRLITQNAEDIIWTANMELKLTYVSPSLERALGYTAGELMALRPAKLLTPASLASGLKVFRQEVAAAQPLPDPNYARVLEMEYRRKDGSKFWVEMKFSFFRDAAGKPTGVLGVGREVTDRKQAEEALRKSEAYYRMLTESLSDFIVHMDREGKILYVNHLAEGYSIEQVQGSSTYDYVPPEYHETMRQALNTVFQEGQPVIFETQGQTSATTIGWYLTRLVPVRENQTVTSALLISTDITERKQADEKIRKLSRAVEQSPASIVITNTAGEIEYVNPRFTQVTGYTSEAALGKNPRILKSGYTTDAEYKQMWEAITSGREWHGEFRNKKSNGDLYWEFAVISPLSNDRGEITHFIAVKEDITDRKQAEELIQRQVEHLRALRMIDTTITASTDLHLSLQFILQQVLAHLRVDAADILLLNPITHLLEYAAGLGFRRRGIEKASLPLSEDPAGQVVMERRTVFIHDLKAGDDTRKQILAGEDFTFYGGVPLTAKGEVKGILEVYNRAHIHLDQEWTEFLEALAGQAALAIDDITLFENLQRSNFELSLAYETTLEGWSNAMDLRDKETEGHTQRVTALTLKLAQQMAIPDSELIHIRRGGLLHDIGKLGVPDNILLKDEDLTEAEWEIMRKHTTYAFEMLSPITYLEPALDIPHYHHEKWDGTGYPQGLKGEQIPLAARLFAVVDVWDALTSDRPYRPAWTKEEALDYIKEQSGLYFDPQVVGPFLRLIGDL